MSDDIEPPDIASWLSAVVAEQRQYYENQFAPPDPSDAALHRALDAMERWAESLFLRGEIPKGLAEALADYSPGDSTVTKVRSLLAYEVVHHRLEFDIADSVAFRLRNLNKRVRISALLTLIFVRYTQSHTARKYFERATSLFLAGYDSEAVIMAAAVLEAALVHRFPDDLLARDYPKAPAFKEAGYAVSQRLDFERRQQPILNGKQRQAARDLMSWRNDAVHVQPDITPQAADALAALVLVLPSLFPSDLDDAT